MLHGKKHEVQKAQQEQDAARRPTVTFASEEELRNNTQLTKVYRLSERELDVLILLLGARSVPAIAGALFISENTVKSHTKSIYRKLGIHNRQELLGLTALILSRSADN
jgi:DNA-binding NarL/FixJ family response regulator